MPSRTIPAVPAFTVCLRFTVDAPDVSMCEGQRRVAVGSTHSMNLRFATKRAALLAVAEVKRGSHDSLCEYVSSFSVWSRTVSITEERARPDLATHAREVAACRAFMRLDAAEQAAYFAAQRATYEAHGAAAAIAAAA